MIHTFNILKSLFEDKKIPEASAPKFPRQRHTEPISVKPQISKEKISEEKISARAFMIWQERDCRHGNDIDDWLLAKLQLEDECLN